MKKIWNVLIVLLLLGALFPLALADEAEEGSDSEYIDDETAKEVEIMGNKYGASIRLLQLEKSITRNIAKGEVIISYLETNTSVNTTELEAILGQLELLKDEISEADPNSTDAVEVFVDLKYDAINLSKEFRTILHDLVDNETLDSIRSEVKNLVNGSIYNIGQKIRLQVRFYNAARLKIMAGYLGEYDSAVVEQYRNGSLNMSHVRQKIAERVRNMSKEKRQEIYSKIVQLRVRRRIQAQSCIANCTQGYKLRYMQRLQNRYDTVQGMSDGPVKQAIKKHISDKLNDGNGYGGGR